MHVLLNRISPEDGRLLSSSKEKLNLSRWAQGYEEERGKVYCEDRVLNNAARDRDEYTRGDKDKARHIYEREAANDNSARAALLQAQHREQAAALADRGRDLRAKQAAQLEDLVRGHAARRNKILEDSARQRTIAIDQVRKSYRDRWQELARAKQDERAAFDEREQRVIGRLHNALASIDFGALLEPTERRRALSGAFGALSSKGARLEALRRSQEAKAVEVLRVQRADEARAADLEDARRQQAADRSRQRFLASREETLAQQAQERAALQAEWRAHGQAQREAWAKLEREKKRRERLKSWAPEGRTDQVKRDAPPSPTPPGKAATSPQTRQEREARRRERQQAFMAKRQPWRARDDDFER